MVAVALCAWLDKAATANPVATTRQRRIKLIFGIEVFIVCITLELLFGLGFGDQAQSGPVSMNGMAETGKCSTIMSKKWNHVKVGRAQNSAGGENYDR